MKKEYKVYLWIFFLALISSFIGSAITRSLIYRDRHSYFEKGMKMGSYITANKIRREHQVYVSMDETLYVKACLKSEGNYSVLRLGDKVFNRRSELINIKRSNGNIDKIHIYSRPLDSAEIARIYEELDTFHYQYIPMGDLFSPN